MGGCTSSEKRTSSGKHTTAVAQKESDFQSYPSVSASHSRTNKHKLDHSDNYSSSHTDTDYPSFSTSNSRTDTNIAHRSGWSSYPKGGVGGEPLREGGSSSTASWNNNRVFVSNSDNVKERQPHEQEETANADDNGSSIPSGKEVIDVRALLSSTQKSPKRTSHATRKEETPLNVPYTQSKNASDIKFDSPKVDWWKRAENISNDAHLGSQQNRPG